MVLLRRLHSNWVKWIMRRTDLQPPVKTTGRKKSDLLSSTVSISESVACSSGALCAKFNVFIEGGNQNCVFLIRRELIVNSCNKRLTSGIILEQLVVVQLLKKSPYYLLILSTSCHFPSSSVLSSAFLLNMIHLTYTLIQNDKHFQSLRFRIAGGLKEILK